METLDNSTIDLSPNQYLEALIEQLDELLAIIYANQASKRQVIIQRYLAHELAQISSPKNPTEQTLSLEEYQKIGLRCLFFACQEVLPFLTRRYLFHAHDHLMHEEIILYIQDRLMAQNFRRIALYQENRNTRFKTYIQRIIHNLAIDFLRKYSREAEIIDSKIEIEQPENQHLDQRIENPDEQSFHPEESLDWIQSLLQDNQSHIAISETTENRTATSQHQQLGERLNLETSERLFLKAIYFGGLSAEQAGALPGIELNKNQANSLHRRLLERLADLFKQLNLYQELQQLVIETDGLQKVLIGDLQVRVVMQQLILLTHNRSLNQSMSHCQVEYQNQAVAGQIEQSFSQLRKRLYQQMLDIRNDAMAGEHYLQELDKKKTRLKLRLLEEWQEVQPRYRKKIKQYFATQFTD